MNSLIRDGNNYDSYEWKNNGTEVVPQFGMVLLNNEDGHSFPVFGYVPSYIAVGVEGNINTMVGGEWQVDQIDETVVAMEKYAPMFATPGYNDLHSVALAGDWCIGYVSEDQTESTWVKIKMVPPFQAEDIT